MKIFKVSSPTSFTRVWALVLRILKHLNAFSQFREEVWTPQLLTAHWFWWDCILDNVIKYSFIKITGAFLWKKDPDPGVPKCPYPDQQHCKNGMNKSVNHGRRNNCHKFNRFKKGHVSECLLLKILLSVFLSYPRVYFRSKKDGKIDKLLNNT